MIYNILGQEVSRLVDEPLPTGFHSVRWDGKNGRGVTMSSGIYLYRMQAGDFTRLRKMSLVH